MGTKVYSNSAHIDVISAYDCYILAIRDSVEKHVNEPQACYGAADIWRNVASRLERDLEELSLNVEMFALQDAAYVLCNPADKRTIDIVLSRYNSRHPRRPVSKSA
jgi:hypothetical protein